MIEERDTYLNSTCQEHSVSNANLNLEAVRKDAFQLLSAIDVSRVIVVDDEYAAEVEELIGICSESSFSATSIAILKEVDFSESMDVWTDKLREIWVGLSESNRSHLLKQARELITGEFENAIDASAAESLSEILDNVPNVEYITLSLQEWRKRSKELLSDNKTSNTVLLFDRDFGREGSGSENEGIKLVRAVQSGGFSCCGLISHTFSRGDEYENWKSLATEHGLDRDRFVVISKDRLNPDSLDYYGFLGLLRLVALSVRYAEVKSNAWSIFENSLTKAKEAVDSLSALDFDTIVFRSSRNEGVRESGTLFRLFSIFMRREAHSQLNDHQGITDAIARVQSISDAPEKIATALAGESASNEAIRVQRFENYEFDRELNLLHAPIDLGDIFKNTENEKYFILLVQPCDLMVRGNGKRSYDNKLYRTGAMAEIVVNPDGCKPSLQELPFFFCRPELGTAYIDFAKVHQALLAVLDLCTIQSDGVARIDVSQSCPHRLADPWKKRYKLLKKFFGDALVGNGESKDGQPNASPESMALTRFSYTAQITSKACDHALEYDLRRVMRLRQPRSGAVLTSFSQYSARAAFEHDFATSGHN